MKLQRVLIVEDVYIIARIMLLKLKKFGYDVYHAHTGESALEKIKKDPFYFIFMDIGLGDGIDGIEATRRIRALEVELNRPRCPIIACTAHITDEDKARYLASGMDMVVKKPLTDERFLLAEAKVKTLWEQQGKDY